LGDKGFYGTSARTAKPMLLVCLHIQEFTDDLRHRLQTVNLCVRFVSAFKSSLLIPNTDCEHYIEMLRYRKTGKLEIVMRSRKRGMRAPVVVDVRAPVVVGVMPMKVEKK